MTKLLRRLTVGMFAVAAVTACDDGIDPIATGTVEIRAYVDADESEDFDATADDAIEGATITLTEVGNDSNTLTESTSAEGLATFDAAVGSYTVSIELPSGMTGVTLATATTPTVVVEDDGTASASFRYTYNPGSITGHAFVGSGAFAEGDPVVPGLEVTVSQGGEVMTTVETDASGEFTAAGLLPGDYTVEVAVPAYLSAASASQTVTVTADEDATADFGFDVVITHTVAEARAAAVDDTVSVVAVAITGLAGDSAVLSTSSFYFQDEAGISIFRSDVDANVELGDSVLVYGVRGAFSSEVQLAAEAMVVLGAGTLPTPTTVTPTQVNNDEFQGELHILDDVYVDSIDGRDVHVSDLVTGVGTVIYVDADAGIDVEATFTVGNVYDVTGVVARFFDLFELKPRMPSDVVEETAVAGTVADARDADVDASVEVTGVVTEDGTLEGNGFYMEDATAGIFVYMGSSGGVPAGLEIGTVVSVSGTRAQFFDISQIGGTVTVTETGETVEVEPSPITPAELNTGAFQGRLVVLTDVTLDSIDGSNLYVTAAEGGDTAVVRLDSDSNVSAAGFTVGETYTIAGVVSNFSGTEQVKPRFEADVEGTMVVEPVTTISEARAAESGAPVELTGVVTVTNGSDGMLDYRNAYMQDATGGILIRMPTDSVVTLGDSVTVTGTTGAFVMELQVNVDASGITRHGTGTIPTARVVTPADLNAGDYQGELAVMQGVEVTAIDGAEVTVTDGTEEAVVYIDSTTGIDVGTTFTVGSTYDVTGVMSRYNTLFELKPRQDSDIVAQ